MRYPPNEIPDWLVWDFAKRVLSKLAIGIKKIPGEDCEEILAGVLGVPWKLSNKGIIDVFDDDLGLCVKSKEEKFPLTNKNTLLVMGRNSPIKHGHHVEVGVTPPERVGEIITNIWNEKLTTAYELCDDVRIFVILKSKDLFHWVLFERLPEYYDYKEFVWTWEVNKNTLGLVGRRDDTRISWGQSGSHFNVRQSIPKDYRMFALMKPDVKVAEHNVLDDPNYSNLNHYIFIDKDGVVSIPQNKAKLV